MLAGIAIAMLLTACTVAEDDADVTAEATVGVTASPSPLPVTQSTTPAFGGVQGEIPAMDEIANDPELRNHVRLTGCEQTSGGWSGDGTAANPTATDATYRLVILFTDAQARTVTSSTIDLPVPAGADVAWTAEAAFTPSEGTSCVLAGVATAPEK